MTAGNLIFGFLAVLKIFEGSIQRETGGAELGPLLSRQHLLHPRRLRLRSARRPPRPPRRQGKPLRPRVRFPGRHRQLRRRARAARFQDRALRHPAPDRLAHRRLLSALRRAPAGAVQHRRHLQSRHRHAQLHRLSHSRRRRAHLLHHAAHHLQLPERRRNSPPATPASAWPR